jgi:hypothetical protein
MRVFSLASLLAITLGVSSCTQSTKTTESKKEDVVADASIAKNDTLSVLQNYLALKDQLVKSDAKGAKEAASKLSVDLGNIKGCTQTAGISSQIASTEDVKLQRKEFLLLSNDIITLIKGSKLKNKTAFVNYCPMAGNGKGGYWLSSSKIIENPYFGDDMKECGEIKEQIN